MLWRNSWTFPLINISKYSAYGNCFFVRFKWKWFLFSYRYYFLLFLRLFHFLHLAIVQTFYTHIFFRVGDSLGAEKLTTSTMNLSTKKKGEHEMRKRKKFRFEARDTKQINERCSCCNASLMIKILVGGVIVNIQNEIGSKRGNEKKIDWH